MTRIKRPAQKDNLKMVVFFLLGVTTLIVLSFLFKLIAVAAKSRFDGLHNFTIAVASKTPNKKVTLLSYAPDRGTIAVLRVRGIDTPTSVGKVVEVPIDGRIITDNQLFFADNFGDDREDVVAATKHFLFLPTEQKQSITFVDLFRLLFFTHSVSSHNILTKALPLPADSSTIDKTAFLLFADQSIAQEKVSIAIVNGTGMPGLGNRLARMLGNIGGNVVAVSTADDTIATSTIAFSKEKLYTAQRIAHVLSFPLIKEEKPSVADITIFIGKDKADNVVF